MRTYTFAGFLALPIPIAQLTAAERLYEKRTLLDNEQIHVFELNFQPGGASPLHSHDYSRLVYVLNGGLLELAKPDGIAKRKDLKPGKVVWRPAETAPLVKGDAALSMAVRFPIWVLPLALALACVILILRMGDWRAHPGMVASGGLLGLLVPVGWWVTGAAGQDDFATHAPASLAIAGPLARGAAYLTTGQATGTGFPVLLILGVFIGAFASAIATKRFRWNPHDGSRVGVYLAGGALMGAGAVLAGGCNIGQGLTGVATGLAGSVLALFGIMAGLLLSLWRLAHENNKKRHSDFTSADLRQGRRII